MEGVIGRMYNRLLSAIQEPQVVKARYELRYWRTRKAEEGILSNDHYEYFYTTYFGLDRSFYYGKKILDVGCGPRGSLEWADMAAERIGLDPLADSYRNLGVENLKMNFVRGNAETIPFPDGYLDVVSSFNSLDHVEDLDSTISEIMRVIAPNGLFLLLTDVHPRPTICEPIVFSWDIVDSFGAKLELLEVRHYEKKIPGMYEGIMEDVAFDHSNPSARYGVLSAKFIKQLSENT